MTDEQGFEFRILGPLEVRAGGRPVALGRPKLRALLALLLLHRGDTVARERLIAELWGERPPKAVAAELRVYVAKLRKALRPDLLVTRDGGYALHVEGGDVDADRFERGARRGSALLAAGDSATAAQVLAESLALWRGAPLGALGDEPWAQAEVRRLEELRLLALEERLEADLALGRQVGVLGELERLVAEHPYRERPRAQLMLALYRCGRQTEALELYRRTARLFAEELGIEPGRELRQRERAILNHDPSLSTREIAEGNLPAPPTPLIGRRRELDELAWLLTQPQVRLVTLTGPGGSGKTRLALEVAARLERERSIPTFLVELAPLTNPTLVLPTIARTVGVEETSGTSTVEALRAVLRHQPILLVLDNFEHLLDAAAQIAELVAAVPTLTVLATSRRSLHIRAERCYDVDPLPIEDAFRLFIERVRAVRRDFDPTADSDSVCRQICERVDCLPLGIELAAARARRTDLTLLLSRLDDRSDLGGGFRDAPDRQRTLWATIDWSRQLLPEEERRLLERLSIFRGSFSLQAVCSVCDTNAGVLAALLEASMLRARGDRFFMLETVREFAEATLASSDRDTIRRRHAEFFFTVAQQARKELTGTQAAAELERLDDDLDNLRVAFDWWLDAGSPEQLLIFANSLSRLFSTSARAVEGAAWLLLALERTASADVPPRLRVVGLIRAAHLKSQVGDVVGAERLYEEALLLARSHADAAGESAGLTGLATLGHADDERVISMQERAVELARDVCAERELAIGLDNLAKLHLVNGDLDSAAEELAEAMEIHDRLGDVVNECISLLRVGNLALHRGETDDAIASFRRAIAMGRQLRSPWLSGGGVEGLAAALLAHGADAKHVVRLIGASEALFAASGLAERYGDGYHATASSGDHTTTLKAAVEAEARRSLNTATYDRAWSEGRALDSAAAVELALAAGLTAPRDVPPAVR